MRRLLTSVVLAVIVVAAGACARPEPEPGAASLQVHDGSVVLVGPADGPARPVTGDRTLARGRVVSVRSGGATLVLAGGAALELRGGSELVVDRRPELRGGDVLAVSGERPVALEAAATSLTVAGAAKLSRSLAVSVTTFDGSVEVASAGRTLSVPALRRATVPAFGLVPPRAVPLTYDVDDAWDRRFLGLAMDLTEALQSYSDGFSALPRPARSVGLDALLPQLPTSALLGEVLDQRSPGEALVGAAVAVVAARPTSAIGERWREVFGFRDEGAAWGLVVLDQAIADPSTVLALVGEASRRVFDTGQGGAAGATPAVESAPGPAAPPAPASTTRPAAPATTAPVVTLPQVPTVTVPVTAPPVVSLPPVELPPVTVPPLDPVAEAVVGLVDDVTETLTGTVTGTVPGLLR